MKKLRLIIICTFLITFSEFVIAGCGSDDTAKCYYYNAGKLISKSGCTVTTCSNIHETFSEWKWNNGNEVRIEASNSEGIYIINYNKKGIIKINRKGLYCFGIVRSSEVLCTSSDNMF